MIAGVKHGDASAEEYPQGPVQLYVLPFAPLRHTEFPSQIVPPPVAIMFGKALTVTDKV